MSITLPSHLYREDITSLIAAGYLSAKPHPTLDLDLIDYTQKTQGEGYWTDVTETCRGVVIDVSGRIVSRPFRKFHHWTQIVMPPAAPLVYDKIDGSMILASLYQGELLVTSRSSFTSQHATEARRLLERIDWVPDAAYTYCFELIHPLFRIVCNYGERTELVLLAKIETATGLEVRLDDVADWPGAKADQYDIAWPLVDPDDYAVDNREGFVLVWPDHGVRAKVKFSEYVRLHGLLTGISAKTIWQRLRNGESLDELRANVPDEFLLWVDEQEHALRRQHDQLATTLALEFDALRSRHHDRKAFALAVQDHQYKAALFRMFGGHDASDMIWKLIEPERTVPFWNRETE